MREARAPQWTPHMVAVACTAALLDAMNISAVTVTVPHMPRKKAVLAAARIVLGTSRGGTPLKLGTPASAAREVTCINAALDVMGTRTVRTAVSITVITLAKATPNAAALLLTPPTSRGIN